MISRPFAYNMILFELFGTDGAMTERMRQAALDIITPFLGQRLKFVTVQQVLEPLRNKHFGIVISRGLLLKLLNPDEVSAIDKIQGDRIYLARPDEGEQGEVDQQQSTKDGEHVQDMAREMSQKAVKGE